MKGAGNVTGMAYVEPEVWYQRLPTFYASAGALITDTAGRILLVKPNYRDGWALPGGTLEPDETPEAACAREVHEDLGLELPPTRLLVVDWAPADGERPRPFVYFLFDCGTIDADQPIRLQTDELDDYRYVDPDQAERHLASHVAARVPAAVRSRLNGTTIYLPMNRPDRDRPGHHG
jgi:8-oxo-dGTP diphosphatase